MGLQKLPNRRLRYSKQDLRVQLLGCYCVLTSTFWAHSGYAGSTGTSQLDAVEAIASNIVFESLVNNIQSQILFCFKIKVSWTDDLVSSMIYSMYETLGMRRLQCVLRGRFL